MTVHELRRVASALGRDEAHARPVDAVVRLAQRNDLSPQLVEERLPEGIALVERENFRDSDDHV